MLFRSTTVSGTTPDEIIPHLGDADIVSVVGTKMPAPVIDALHANGRCRAIARLGAGTDRIDVARATEREYEEQDWQRHTEDFREGTKAMGERRLPNFTIR